MGYSIAVPVRSEKLRKRMQAFMDENYKDNTKLFPGKYDYPGAHGPTNDLSYDDGKCRIGFNYGCMGGSERQYIYSLTRWMSLKVGRKRKLELFYGSAIRDTVPYIVYDGTKAWPTVLHDEWKDKAPYRDNNYEPGGWTMYDEFGWEITGEQSHSMLQRAVKAIVEGTLKHELKVMHEEIKRLDALWKEQS